jgi:S1-C subfamily serine protease
MKPGRLGPSFLSQELHLVTIRQRAPWASRGVAVAGASLVVGLGAGIAVADHTGGDSTASPNVAVVGAQPTALSTASSKSVTEIANASLPGVVDIVVSGVSAATSGDQPFGAPGGGQGGQGVSGEGSGFVIDSQGHIVTNAHVVDGAQSIKVRFADGTQADATLVGKDVSSDLAVIDVKVSADKLHPLVLGKSGDLQVGQGVVAIGSPFGLQGTVTTGIVSALHRTIDAPNGYSIPGAIQTDAAINHGNSGGPLLNAQGEVIGVNAQIASDSGGNDGVGFAIPVDTVQNITGQLVEGGAVSHPYLGVSVATVDAGTAAQLGIPQGAQIGSVKPGSPAATAGLTGSGSTTGQPTQTGDVITAIDGKAVTSAEDLTSAVAAHKPGDTVTLTVSSGGQSHDVKVTLGTRP